MDFKKTVAVDFDGVLNNYHGYDPDDLGTIRDGAREFIECLYLKYSIIIYSTRDSTNIRHWLKKYHLDKYITKVSNKKPPAVAYIDDRAIRFNGDYTKCLHDFTEKAYWQEDD